MKRPKHSRMEERVIARFDQGVAYEVARELISSRICEYLTAQRRLKEEDVKFALFDDSIKQLIQIRNQLDPKNTEAVEAVSSLLESSFRVDCVLGGVRAA